MRHYLFFLSILLLLVVQTSLLGQRKVKPIYYGKIQGAYVIDKFIPEGYAGFNYFNLGVRKMTGDKLREFGIATFYYQEDLLFLQRSIFSEGGPDRQTGFLFNTYAYIGWKQRKWKKARFHTGPQFDFGYYHNEMLPGTSVSFPIRTNDFKVSGSARAEFQYEIDPRYSFFVGAQYTLFQFGLRRIKKDNPILTRRQQLEDFIQFDFLIERYIGYFGVLRRFGKIRKTAAQRRKEREKANQKRAADQQKRQEKLKKKRAKQQKKKKKKN